MTEQLQLEFETRARALEREFVRRTIALVKEFEARLERSKPRKVVKRRLGRLSKEARKELAKFRRQAKAKGRANESGATF